MKEQCVVLFPYNAVNDDELTLEEGQIVTIVTKEVEDKGWWKGEIDGRVGVFPVSIIFLSTLWQFYSIHHFLPLVKKPPLRS